MADDNLAYVTEHRWPPLSYEQAMEDYRKKYLEDEESGEGDEEEGKNSGHKKSRRIKTLKSRGKCKVM